MECKNALFEKGAASVSAFVTHAIFPNSAWRKFAEEKGCQRFETFYVTNSCPEVTDLLVNQSPFKVLSLATSICKNLDIHL